MSERRAPNARTPLRVHVWLGTLAAIPLLVIAGSGVVLGFFDPLRYATRPHRLDDAVHSPLPPSRLLELVQAAHPEHRVHRLRLPPRPDAAAVATLNGPDERTVFVHPGSGAALATRPGPGTDWLDAVRSLHHGKPLGELGRIVASAAGVAAVALWAVGALVRARLPRRAAVTQASWLRPRMLGWHRRFGLVAGAALALVALTGTVLNHAAPLRAWLLPEPRPAGGPGGRPELAAAVVVGAAAYDAAPLDRVDVPSDASAPVRLRFRDGAWVHVDGARGRVLRVAPPGSHPLLLLYPLHSGRIFGRAGPPALAAVGLVSTWLVLTGGFFHLRRRGSPE